jgi:hypothetical protein
MKDTLDDTNLDTSLRHINSVHNLFSKIHFSITLHACFIPVYLIALIWSSW